MICIALSGGSGSGKSSVLQWIINLEKANQITVLPMDAYYKDHSHLSMQQKRKWNFDHPDAIDIELLMQQIQSLKQNQTIQRPVYSFITCTRLSETVKVCPGEIIFIEGLFTLYHEKLRKMFDFSVFLDGTEQIRLERIIQRDISERNRSREETYERFFSMVAPMHNQYVEPTRKYADKIIDTSHNDISYIASLIWEAARVKIK
jgi:uridine kinase